jgi:hypothetical protein
MTGNVDNALLFLINSLFGLYLAIGGERWM